MNKNNYEILASNATQLDIRTANNQMATIVYSSDTFTISILSQLGHRFAPIHRTNWMDAMAALCNALNVDDTVNTSNQLYNWFKGVR